MSDCWIIDNRDELPICGTCKYEKMRVKVLKNPAEFIEAWEAAKSPPERVCSRLVFVPFVSHVDVTEHTRFLSYHDSTIAIMDPWARCVKKGAIESKTLTATEMMVCLALLPGESMNREELRKIVWAGKSTEANNLDVTISRVRKKLAPLGIELIHEGGSYRVE